MKKEFSVKNKNKILQNDLNKIKKSLFEERCNIPNPPLNNVVKGKSTDDNEIIKEVLKLIKLDVNSLLIGIWVKNTI